MNNHCDICAHCDITDDWHRLETHLSFLVLYKEHSDNQTAKELYEEARQQEQTFYDAYRTLGRLQTFVWINAKGFQKIMKKYDKRQQLRGTGNELGPDFEKRLEKEAFCSGKLEVLPLAWLHSPCPYSLWLYLLRLYLLHSGARGALQAAAAHGGEQQCYGRRRRRQAADATPRGQRQP